MTRGRDANAAPRGEASPAARRSSFGSIIPSRFYDRDPALVARELLGAVLECRSDDGLASGRIVETEAYLGPHDPACHAVVGRTRRTWHLHGPPGIAYVYFIYGTYWCFNAVTLPEGIGSAVLVRALVPLEGVELMRARRPAAKRDRDLCNGPGKLCLALAIDGRLDGVSLARGPLVIRRGTPVPDEAVEVTPRIGITSAADWPLRFLVRGDEHVSRTPRGFFRRGFQRDGDPG
jgi:DNA-3-methyladenine glycosylase